MFQKYCCLLFVVFTISISYDFAQDIEEELPSEAPVRKVNIDAALRKVFTYLTSLVPNLTVQDYLMLEKMYDIPPAEALRYRKFITETIVDEIFSVLTKPFEKDQSEDVSSPVISNVDVIDRQLGPIERL